MRVTVFVFTIIFIIHHQNGIRCQNVQFEITAKKPGFPVIIGKVSFSYYLNSMSCVEYGKHKNLFLYHKLIVPGDGGTHMEARLNKPAVVHYMCTKKTDDFFNIWLNLELMVPFILDCWVDNVR